MVFKYAIFPRFHTALSKYQQQRQQGQRLPNERTVAFVMYVRLGVCVGGGVNVMQRHRVKHLLLKYFPLSNECVS